MLLPGRTTLASIRYQTRTRADRWIVGAPVNPVFPDPFAQNYVTTSELNLMIQASAGELYELLVNQYSNYWFTDKLITTCDGAAEQYPLALNQLKHLSTEWVGSPALVSGPSGPNTVNTNDTNNVVLRRLNLNDRDMFSFNGLTMPPVWGVGACWYTVYGNTMWFKPRPPGGTVMQTLFVPIPLPLVDTGTITLNSVVAGNTLTISARVGIADPVPVTFTAVDADPGQFDFVVGDTDAITAANLSAKLNASSLGGLAGVLTAYNSATVLGGTQVQLCFVNPCIITWSTSGNTLLLSPNQTTDALGTVISFSNVFTGYAGLEEYVVVDAAIKMMQKEESDVGVLMAQKQALIARYQRNYQNRDPGQPRTATDSKRRGGGIGGMGWGGWGGY